jgi:hypothetical protein
MIENLTLDDGRVSFFVTADKKGEFIEGNALIAAFDAQDKVVWSWHVWVTQYDPSAESVTSAAGDVFMTRNLGAGAGGNATEDDIYLSYGLYYQWGRPTPMIGPAYYNCAFAEDHKMYNINGLGERAGNAPLASVQAILKDHFHAITRIDESRLNDVSRVVESYSGVTIPANKPIVGESVFTQVAGVHADGDNKNKLYFNDLLPERFGRVREYALGKNSGKANIRKNLESMGLELDEESMRKVTERIIELGDRKELVTPEDLPYIISDVLKHDGIQNKVKLLSYFVTLAKGLKPMATLSIEINGKTYQESSSGDGQYDAFVRALRKIYKGTLGRKFPMLLNYAVTIPPGGRTDEHYTDDKK